MRTNKARELLPVLCERLAKGEYTSKACKELGINRGELWKVVEGEEAVPELASMYARAREWQAEAHADRIVELSEDVLAGKYDYNSARVAIDALKWSASKLRPRVYGDRLEVSGKQDVSVTISLAAPPSSPLTTSSLTLPAGQTLAIEKNSYVSQAIEAHVVSEEPRVRQEGDPAHARMGKRKRGPQRG
jgi:hypothetical protein